MILAAPIRFAPITQFFMSPDTLKLVKLIGWNLLMVVGLYWAIVERIVWVEYLAIGVIWLILVAYLTVVFSTELRTKYQRKQHGKIGSFVADFFDVGIIAALIAFQWYFTAFAYGASAFVQRVIYGQIALRK